MGKPRFDKARLARWSKAVRWYFGNRCHRCGSKKYIQAHHLKPKSLYPKLAYNLRNGRPLCRFCHIESEDSIHSLVPLHKCNEKTYYKWLKETKSKYQTSPIYSYILFIFIMIVLFAFITNIK